MKKQSTEIIAMLVILVGFILQGTDIKIATESLTTFLEVAFQLGGLVYLYIKRYQRGDINILGRKI